MLMILAVAAAWSGWRLTRAALRSLRELPRRNEDLVYW